MKKSVLLLIFVLFSFSLSAVERNDEGWRIIADDYSADYTGVPVASGRLGILPWKEPFSVRHLMMNHVFERMGGDMVNSVVKAINPFNLELYCDGRKLSENNMKAWRQTIDMREAEHITEFTAFGKLNVKYSFVALRNMPYSILMNVEIEALDDVDVKFVNSMYVPEDYKASYSLERESFFADGHPMVMLKASAVTAEGRYNVSASSMFIAPEGFERGGNKRGDRLSASMKKGESRSFTLAASICSTCDFSDPFNETKRQLIFIDVETVPKVMEAHKAKWEELWQGDIEIEGDMEAQKVVRLALFNIYGFCHEGSRLSISPMGLSSNGYNGHIFWDTELWMYPPMLLMNQGIARSMMDYRYDRLEAAERKADAYGYKGAMFPWESDYFGEESTPVWALTGPMEHHITADIGIAAWNYYRVTGDRRWLETEGMSLLTAVADFWVSRVRANDDGTYSIAGVVGADEYAQNVTDNAFTNASAVTALRYAVKAAEICGVKAPEEWAKVADGIRILEDEEGIILEYQGYEGQKIKQADVNLLAYPLGLMTDEGRILKNLEYYEDKVDNVNGPAMTFGIFAVQYARLGMPEKAEEMFRRSYRPNMRPPFGALAETPTSNNPYFATGAGALLQAVLNGFMGLEITEDGIQQSEPVLPPSWTRLAVHGVGPEKKTYVIENKK